MLNDAAAAHALVALWIGAADPARFHPTVAALARCDLPLVLGTVAGADVEVLRGAARFEHSTADSYEAFITPIISTSTVPIVSVHDAALMTPDAFVVALETMRADLRVATVSFLTNDGWFASHPWDVPLDRPLEGTDEITTTRALRAACVRTAPVPFPAGPVTVLSPAALGRSALDCRVFGATDSPEELLMALGLAAAQRGFIHILDPSTFCARPSDISVFPPTERPPHAGCDRLVGAFPSALDIVAEHLRPGSPLSAARLSASAATRGIRVVVDGRCLRPQQTGTQVATVAFVEALAGTDQVSRTTVILDDRLPAYASALVHNPNVTLAHVTDDHLLAGHDIAHRPYQPDGRFEIKELRRFAHRVVVTIHDLIAYQVASYHPDTSAWRALRTAMRRVCSDVDGVMVVSDDVRAALRLEALPVTGDRLAVVSNGIDHVTGHETAQMPEELLRRGFATGPYLLVLGANYAHKNRDLAIEAHTLLRSRGHDIALVLVGAAVPHGSSRVAESMAAEPGGDIYVVPDVTEQERNWLLRHARVLLYPTSAEGFGFMPFEAARFGTPTVNVPFGPLRSLAETTPATAAAWTPLAVADATESLLTDPALAQAQVDATIACGSKLTWSEAAAAAAQFYSTILSMPPRTEPESR